MMLIEFCNQLATQGEGSKTGISALSIAADGGRQDRAQNQGRCSNPHLPKLWSQNDLDNHADARMTFVIEPSRCARSIPVTYLTSPKIPDA
ncbi:hypothetical protein ACQY0O_000096 [Thecaphora frezii]